MGAMTSGLADGFMQIYLDAIRVNKRVTDHMGINVDALNETRVSEVMDIYLGALNDGVIDDKFWFAFGDGGPISLVSGNLIGLLFYLLSFIHLVCFLYANS